MLNLLLLKNLPYYVPDTDPTKFSRQVQRALKLGLMERYCTVSGTLTLMVCVVRRLWELPLAVAVLCSFAVKWPGRLVLDGSGKGEGDRETSSEESEKRTAVVDA